MFIFLQCFERQIYICFSSFFKLNIFKVIDGQSYKSLISILSRTSINIEPERVINKHSTVGKPYK